jgi:hypothetical protein
MIDLEKMQLQHLTQQAKQLDPLPERLKSKWWRMTHLYKVKDKGGNLVIFFPNIVQLKHLRDRGSWKRCKICKARQHGITTLYCIDYLDEALWVAGTTSAIIAHEQKALLKIFDIVKRAYENLPWELLPVTDANNTNELKFEYDYRGAKLDSSIYVSLKIRSGTVQNLHITEGAYIKDRKELKAGSLQAVPKTGRVTEETTGNGFNEFYDEFIEAWRNGSPDPEMLDYKAFFYAWFENPDYTLDGVLKQESLSKTELDLRVKYHLTDGQLLWRRWKMKELSSKQEGIGLSGEQLFRQEYPSTVLEAFQSGAGSVFDQEKLERLDGMPPLTEEQIREQCASRSLDPKAILDLVAQGVAFWEIPIFGQEYVTGADPSDGQGSDNTCIDVWTRPDKAGKIRQVAQFYGLVHPDDAAAINKDMAIVFNRAYAGVESNMLTMISHLKDIYDNYYFSTIMDEKTQKKTKKLGWHTNHKTRELMIDAYVKDFTDDSLEIRSKITLSEMRTFVKNRQASGYLKREHAAGKWDDSLFAAFIANQMTLFKPAKARAFAQGATGL